ncbi:MAG: N-acetylmuramic acid 6-phosphate etherase [Planctomycetota bacterium]|nr:N-acetylmuramic acid 6-phosphate etherase [Planctomycetota bacterium]
MRDRGHIATEEAHPGADQLETMGTAEALALMHASDAAVLEALEAARGELASLVDAAAETLRAGGRICYVGAGTSGRLGVLDATECPPTFGVDPEVVQAIIAGGEAAIAGAVEHAEDDPAAGAAALTARALGRGDLVIGIAASGTTPFVRGALDRAREQGARTALIACVPRDQAPDDHPLGARLLVGPEILAGSSRLKAGTATKLALNAVSTLAMARAGKTYRGHMVDVNTRANAKLVERGVRLVTRFGEVERARAAELLETAGGSAKAAIVMARRGTDLAGARALLDDANGFLAEVLDR